MDNTVEKVNRAKVCTLGAERKPTANSIFHVNLVDEEIATRVRSDRLIFMETWQAGFSVPLRSAKWVYGCFHFETTRRKSGESYGAFHSREFAPRQPLLMSTLTRLRLEKICWVSHGCVE